MCYIVLTVCAHDGKTLGFHTRDRTWKETVGGRLIHWAMQNEAQEDYAMWVAQMPVSGKPYLVSFRSHMQHVTWLSQHLD